MLAILRLLYDISNFWFAALELKTVKNYANDFLSKTVLFLHDNNC